MKSGQVARGLKIIVITNEKYSSGSIKNNVDVGIMCENMAIGLD